MKNCSIIPPRLTRASRLSPAQKVRSISLKAKSTSQKSQNTRHRLRDRKAFHRAGIAGLHRHRSRPVGFSNGRGSDRNPQLAGNGVQRGLCTSRSRVSDSVIGHVSQLNLQQIIGLCRYSRWGLDAFAAHCRDGRHGVLAWSLIPLEIWNIMIGIRFLRLGKPEESATMLEGVTLPDS